MKNEGEARDSGLLSNPLSFLRSGTLIWNNADLSNRGGRGYCWLSRSASTFGSNYFSFAESSLITSNSYEHGWGFAVRCVISGGLAPDSICPKGWQLPTYSGDKSFNTLISTSYSMKYNNQTSEDNRDAGVLSIPLSFIRSGAYRWQEGRPYNRNGEGVYWSSNSVATDQSLDLRFAFSYLYSARNDSFGYGHAVRCVELLPNPSPLSLILAIL